MINSLRARLLATLLIVLIVALGTIAFYISRTTTSEFERSLSSILQYRDPRLDTKINNIQKTITQNRGERGIWDLLQVQIEGIESSSQIRIVMTDLEGVVYADSSKKLTGSELNTSLSKPFAAFLVEKTPILSYYEPLNVPNISQIQERFTTSVNRSLLLAILAAGSVTLLLTVLLSTSILRPISALTNAAHKMERGDLSQRVDVKTKDELGELANAFNAMADGLDRLEQLRRNMVTDVAHELRTPLSNIRGYLEALRDEILEATPETISMLHEEAMSLNHLVDELQELALAEAGQLHIERSRVSATEIVNRTISTINQQASTKSVTIVTEIGDDLPVFDTDPERLHQILRNLLNNAITYTPSGGQITIQAQQANDSIKFSVQDTGSGIAPEHLPFIFERFYRADKSRTRATGGAGLGLAIVKYLVEALGGQVYAESDIGKGTTVTFTIPIFTSLKSEETVRSYQSSKLWRTMESIGGEQ